MGCCPSNLLGGGGSDDEAEGLVEHEFVRPAKICSLNPNTKGKDVKLSNNNCTVSGRGTAVALAPLVQQRTYWEVKILKAGYWGVGVADAKMHSERLLGEEEKAWFVSSEREIVHFPTSENIEDDDVRFKEGDVIGCSYDHTTLAFYHNGRKLDECFYTVNSDVAPAVCVDGDAILACNFNHAPFEHPPPPELHFQAIMFETRLL